MYAIGNILDAVHDELPPNVWDNPASPKPVLKPVHAHWITTHIYKVLDKHGYSSPEKWLQLVLTGSLTTYQYGPESDCDVSLFVNATQLPEWSRAEMVGIMVEYGDGVILPGTSYPMQCYVVPHGIKPADLYKPGLRSGYDIQKHHWFEPPDPAHAHNVEAQENGFYTYALEQADKMERLLRYEPNKAVQFWHQIHARRRRDQQAGKGDFSESNIVYKFLSNRGLFPQLADLTGEHIAAIGGRFNPGQHGYKENGQWQQSWGRGLLDAQGVLHTWPEVRAGEWNDMVSPTHMDVVRELGLGNPRSTFMIRPNGEYYTHDSRFVGTEADHQSVMAQDPRLTRVPSPITDGFGYNPMGEEPIEQPLNPPRRTAATLPKSKIPVKQMTPEQLAEYKAAQERAKIESLQWLNDNPRSPENIVDHWNQTTPEHRAQGMSWYQDAHNAAQQIAQDRGITVNQAAGLIANYSPQQHWATNLEMASRAAAGERIGGPKIPGQRGWLASNSQADAAARILNGEDYHNIFRGKKIISFGHLIEHGQDTDPNNPAVVVDRHALGVAHGGYADDGIYAHSKVSGGMRKDGSSPVYDDVANMYRQAADTINANGGYNGVPVQPHQLQAATWLTRQRLNAEGGYSTTDPTVAVRTRKVAENSVNLWNAYAAEHHPALVGKTPGTGFSAQTGAGAVREPAFAKTAETIPMTEPIRPYELSSPTAIERGHSRPVTPEEWHSVAENGRQLYENLAANADGTQGLDAQWPWLKEHGWQSVQQPWGGATINAATGAPIEGQPDLYALTAKEPGMQTVSIPINAQREHFMSAMDEARRRFAHLLERANHHLGIFRDEDVNRIDFDPVLVTDNLPDAEAIGAHTRNIGGAYHFASGDGFWPPHVPDENQVQSAGPGPWPTYAEFRSANRTELPPEWWPEGTPEEGMSQE